jgi:outer membrane protein OmpA-like peptidoglycan-associated protein
MKDAITVSVTGTPSLAGHQAGYRWTSNGQSINGTGPQLVYTVPPQSGTYRVGVTVSDDPAGSADTRTASPVSKELLLVNVKDYRPPSLSGSASPGEVVIGSSSNVSLTPQVTDCNGNLTYNCRADEGRISAGPPFTFDSTGVAFDMTDLSKPQSKQVNISCVVTDARGGTATANVPVTVDMPAVAVAVRFDDIVFAANNARVNNCGKRILLEEVYPRMAEHPDWDVVLVGHSDGSEKAKGMDQKRVLNVAATLSAGTDTCPRLELSRIKVVYAGTDQTSEMRPAFCGTSTRNTSTERGGQAVSADDPNAKNRRVEVYMVPKGAKYPDVAAHMQALPEAQVTALGCPK